ncbi:MAG: Endo-1,4-beta-xylanase A precursor [Firmicutes bacterium ADurb.Bin373]|nr:MAG: Endo-1,4-beta-xylanase A precursor [Firmicutes bacterium ADurb.Bin373]
MRKKSRLSWFILAVFMMTIAFGGVMPNDASAANLTDVQGHWAATQINAMVDQGIVKGYPNNTFKPNANITRAEFIVLSNKSFAFNNTAEINYSDVKSSDWFASDIAKAKAAGYISGYENGTMKPNNNISRQEAAVIVANILKLNSAGSDELKKFKDASSIPAWSASSVAALVKGGILAGYPDGTFQPKKAITRAEAVVILTKAKGTTTPSKPEPGIDLSKISKAGTYGPATGNQAISGDVTISASGVTLQNATVSGDLTITDAVGNGDVTLKNVTVKGTAYIKGGGANSIHLNNCVFGKVVINKAGGNLRVALEGSTSISNLVADSGVNVVGKGTITKATINAANVTIEIKPGTTTVANNISATVAGETVKGSTSSSGGGGGGGCGC